ncbi:MAG: hypothetical protein RLZ51_285, partial [Pseudomonadota bacterium]
MPGSSYDLRRLRRPGCRTRGLLRQQGLGLIGWVLMIPVVLTLTLGLALTLTAVLAWDKLPSLEAVTDYRPKMPLRIFTADGVLIGEFGEERRSVVRIKEVPEVMKQAILAAEDDRFFEH